MEIRFRTFVFHPYALWFVYVALALLASAQKLLLGEQNGYTAYENYIIFRNSFRHVADGLNPYVPYPSEQWDLFKYSPTFALFMGIFNLLPDAIGLIIWNLVNALPLLWAILHLPLLDDRRRQYVAWFVCLELLISLQNAQSNGLMAAFFLLSWIALERGRVIEAAAWIVAGGFLKIFGLLSIFLVWQYPQKKKLFGWVALWLIIGLVLPMLVVSPKQWVQLHVWWWELLRSDHESSLGMSVMGWLQAWFGWEGNKLIVLGVGLVIWLASMVAVRYRYISQKIFANEQAYLWASLLLWVVIFNHKAESPTYVVALCGVSVWYWGTPKPSWFMTILLWFAFVFASLSPSDIFPTYVRTQWVQPYTLKALPCIIIWLVITIQLFFPSNAKLHKS